MFTAGEVVSHYRILEKIGDGGMGVVFRARDEVLERDVAVKVLRPGALLDDAARRRLRKEARVLSKLSHPNIEFLFEFGSHGPEEFLVVEFVQGMSLSDRLTQGPMTEKEIARLGEQLADGLATAHAHGVVHCDLKPGNLFVTREGRLKIIDFGIAKLLRPPEKPRKLDGTTSSSSGDPAVIGTLPYMAPEQLRSEETDGRTDVYATGVVLYEAATRRRPFRQEATPGLIDDILHQPPVPPRALNGKISAELERIILKCLQKDPDNRYQSARELEVDLRQLATPTSSTGIPVVQWPRARTRRRRVTIAALVVLALVAVVAGLMLSGWWPRRPIPPAAGDIQSVAVLPLQNLSGDPGQDYFADGMTDELITQLAQIRALRVISRTSAMRFKGTTKPIREIARELNVDAVVEGSVVRSGERVRITAQLIQAATDQNLWAESYERDLRDVLALQSEVARAIAGGIQINLSPQEESRLHGARTVNPKAYEAYLKGRYYWNQRDREGVTRGLDYFRQAIEMDPSYALAHVGKADSLVIICGNRWVSCKEALPEAEQAALKALELDASSAEAHASLAMVNQLEWDWTGAAREYQRALALNSGYATAHQWYSLLLAEMGRTEQAVAEAQRATELDPLSPIISMNLGQVLYAGRRYAAARKAIERTLEVSPDFIPARYYLGQIYLEEGKFEKSIAELQRAAELSPGDDGTRATLGYAYAMLGRKGDAQAILSDLKDPSRERSVSPYLIATIYAGLGEKDEAFDWLEKAYRQRDIELPWIGMEPQLDSLHSDPRFMNLIRRMNFPK